MKILPFLLILILVSCGDNPNDQGQRQPREYTVVPDMAHSLRDSTGNYMEFGCDYYGHNNFIIDDSSKIYYYAYRFTPGCGTDKDYAKPPFIGLLPHQLIELDETEIDGFIKLNVAPRTDYMKLIIVASSRDTFKSKAIDSLFSKVLTNNDRKLIVIRRMTEEEKIVLKHKKSGDPYYSPSDIEWDTTKTKFWPKDLAVIR
jgi:hypothetical protein